MYSYRKVTDDLYYVGVDDRRLTLFENVHPIPEGVSYNSYVLLDEKAVLFDTVDWDGARQFLENVEAVLDGRKLDYMVINHVEPDHAATIGEILLRYPDVTIISNAKAITFMEQFGFKVEGKTQTVKEGDQISFGKHTVTFVMAPMVHWPEAMVTFDLTDGILFSADAFGSFGALNGNLFNDEVNFDRDWLDSARRYYTNIVGKYGKNTQNVLKKAAGLDIKMICPLHGPVWRNDIPYFLNKYQIWSSYEPEEKGVLIVYGSMYGNTQSAAECLAHALKEKGVSNVKVYDVSKTHVSYLISEAFKYSHIVLASVTYNLGIFPPMDAFINDMAALAVQNRTVGIIENGTWAIKSGDLMKAKLEKMKNMTVLEDKVTLKSSMKPEQKAEIEAMAEKLAETI